MAEKLAAVEAALAVAPTDERLAEIGKTYRYKYFGDYEFSDDQRDAVDEMMLAVLAVEQARAALARPFPSPVCSRGVL